MREYSKVSPGFWTGPVGKYLRSAGRDAQVVALYLMTCPSANMLGLYYLPIPTLCHELSISPQGALKALRRVSEGGFAYYDEASEYVWVVEMASEQIGEQLSVKDNRVTGIKKELSSIKNVPFYNQFLDKYRDAFHLHGISPFEDPSKPLRSQEQEQQHEQEKAEDERRTPQTLPADQQCKRLHLDHVLLTDLEHSRLMERFGQEGAKIWIEEINDARGRNIKEFDKKYTSHYHTILSWARLREKSAKPQSPVPSKKSAPVLYEERDGTVRKATTREVVYSSPQETQATSAAGEGSDMKQRLDQLTRDVAKATAMFR